MTDREDEAADLEQDVDALEPEDETEGDEQSDEGGEGDGEEFAIEIDGEEAAEEETPLIKQLRERERDLARRVAAYEKAERPVIVVGEKPDLWTDFDGDQDKYDEALLAWHDRKGKAATQEADAARAAETRNAESQRRFNAYRAKAAALPVQDFDAAEAKVVAELPELLQAALLNYTKDTEKVVYALAKHPAKLAALAQESDPIKFILAINDLERNLKVVNRRKPPAPEGDTLLRGSAPVSAMPADKQAAKLLAEAERTGNTKKYREYMNSRKAAA